MSLQQVLLRDFAAASHQPAYLSLGVCDLAEVLGHEVLACDDEQIVDRLFRWCAVALVDPCALLN